ncbi:MAG: aminotransferase class V-fold PLP-dependent enzyme, partial [Spirochaetota bacterium]
MKTVYLDNAATSWPKPESVDNAIREFHLTAGANPGRSGHRLSVDAGRIVYRVREKISSLFNAEDPLNVVHTKNATEALNIATLGLLVPGDHVIVSGFEHNAVMRPLRYCESRGVKITVLPVPEDGDIDPDDMLRACRRETKAMYCLHGSNVTGGVMPVSALGKAARERGILLCVDASQTAGVLPIDMREMNIDMLAFTGHKALMGPQGTGGLILQSGISDRIRPIL